MNYFTSMPYNDFRLREPIKRSLEEQIDTYAFEQERADMKKKGFKEGDSTAYWHSEMRKMGFNPEKLEDRKKYYEKREQKYKDEYRQSLGLIYRY